MFFYLVWNNRVQNIRQELQGSELLYNLLYLVWINRNKKITKELYNWARLDFSSSVFMLRFRLQYC